MKKSEKPPLNVYIIMGNGGTRKSSIINALTGHHGRTRIYDIKFKGRTKTEKKVYIITQSLQEYTNNRMAPLAFINFINRERTTNKFDYILIPLLINSSLGSGQDYFNEFRNVGWNILRIEISTINDNHLPDWIDNLPNHAINPFQQRNTELLKPTNVIAAKIRKRWRWM